MRINPETIAFITDLAANNDRDWFAAHRSRYDEALENVKAFGESLVSRMNRADDIERHRHYRIYRDVRFSKDKTPYNPRFGISLMRRKPHLRGSYFVDIEPAQTRVVVGFWGPNSADLALIRDHIDHEGDRFREVVENPELKLVYDRLSGDALKTAPRGYRQDHPHIDLLRHKQFLFRTSFTPAETLAPAFLEDLVFALSAIRPFFDHMSDVLAHDENGVRLY
ncbi:MAG: DUF2461 domain-containing protein [Rhodothermales bacterium]|nr:DUF2461 domain-containing protein [Rhodothermales bacterium]